MELPFHGDALSIKGEPTHAWKKSAKFYAAPLCICSVLAVYTYFNLSNSHLSFAPISNFLFLTGQANASSFMDSEFPKFSEKLPLNRMYRMEGRCQIFTYYHPTSISNPDDQVILQLWKASWFRKGWKPIILNEEHARMHPEFSTLSQKFYELPTVNPKEYEIQCYNRWVAMSSYGGFMCDYDIMNFGMAPPFPDCGKNGPLAGDSAFVPMLISGSKESYISMAREFANYTLIDEDTIGGRPHISDMIIVRLRLIDRIEVHENGSELGTIHFSHHYLGANLGFTGGNRAQMTNNYICYEIARRTSFYARIIPRVEFIQKELDGMAKSLEACSTLALHSGLPSGHNASQTPIKHIVILPPDPNILLLENYSSELISSLFDNGFALRDENLTNPFSIAIAGILGENPEDITSLYESISNDAFFFGGLHRARDLLSILQFELGFHLDSSVFESVVRSFEAFWDKITTSLLLVDNRLKLDFYHQNYLDFKLLEFIDFNVDRKLKVLKENKIL